MSRNKIVVVISGVCLLLAAGISWAASDYPRKPIDLVVPWAAGGTSDLTARALAKSLEPIMGQPIIVTNVTGASGAVGHNKVRQTTPDGYTLLFSSLSFLGGYYMGQYPFNWLELDPLCSLTDEAVVVVVNAASPIKTLGDLLKEMKAKPGKVSWAYTGAGNATHLTAEGVKLAAGADFRGVPYDGGSQVRTAILGGHMDAACITGGEAWKDAQAGSLRILASSLPKESPSLPGVKPLKEQGVDFQFVLWKGLFVPKGTPDAVKDALCKAIAKAVQDPEFVKLMTSIRSDVNFLPYKEFGMLLEKDDQVMKQLLTKMGLVQAK
jgi:tripartite-type tricarboxylate transporter receptor subunit TctC